MLVDRADLTPPVLAAVGATLPEVRDAGLAPLAAKGRHVRVEQPMLGAVQALGVPTVEVGYHRGSDGMFFADAGGPGREVDAGEVWGSVADDRANGRGEPSRDDAVGALIAILSEGTVTERDVLVAAALPALGGEPGRDADDPEQLPVIAEEVIEAVSLVLGRPRAPGGPSVAERRAWQRKAALVLAVAVPAEILLVARFPVVTVFAVPVMVFAAMIVALHEAAIRGRSV